MQWVAVAVLVAAAVGFLTPAMRRYHRNGPLGREIKPQPVTFRTELRWLKIETPPWWMHGAEDGIRNVDLIVRGDLIQVGNIISAVMGVEYYFRGPGDDGRGVAGSAAQ